MAEKDLISKPDLADGSGHVHRRDVLKGMIGHLGFTTMRMKLRVIRTGAKGISLPQLNGRMP